MKKLVVKTVVRTLVYQLLLVFVGLTIGFYIHSEYWGEKAPLIQRSIKNIFYPLKYSDKLELALMKIGRDRLYLLLDEPPNLTTHNEKMVNQEWYDTDYSYETPQGGTERGHFRTRILWKTWESYYEVPEPFPNE